jgi:uncharacterized protein with HEPN domain
MRAETAKRLHDALTACSKIQSFIAGGDLVTYESSDLIRSASERQLEILGEALNQARRHDPALIDQIPHVRSIIGMRNRIAHGYDDVRDEIVWDTLQNDIPRLKRSPDALLNTAS